MSKCEMNIKIVFEYDELDIHNNPVSRNYRAIDALKYAGVIKGRDRVVVEFRVIESPKTYDCNLPIRCNTRPEDCGGCCHAIEKK